MPLQKLSWNNIHVHGTSKIDAEFDRLVVWIIFFSKDTLIE